MMKSILTLLFFIGLSYNNQALSQPTVEWEVSFGSSGWDTGDHILQTTDGGYILTGYAATNDSDAASANGGGDAWIIKLSETGAFEWQKFYGGSGNDGMAAIQQTDDGGFILAGGSDSNDGDVGGNNGGLDVWVLKLNQTGDLEWEENYGGSDADWANDIQQTTDGGFIIAGLSKSGDGDVGANFGDTDFWVLKISSNGSLEWQKNYGGSDSEGARAVQQTTDGGYIVAGLSQSTDGDVNGDDEFTDYWIVKLNSAGIIDWAETYGGSNADGAYAIQQTSEGGYIVSGWAPSFDGDITSNQGPDTGEFWILKLSATGNIEWEKSYGGTVHDRAHSIQQTSDGGYISTGYTVYNTGDYNVLTIKMDSAGNLEWEKNLGGSQEDHGEHIRQTTDGGYIICGKSWSSDGDVSENNGFSDIWVVKLANPTSTHQLDNNVSVNIHPNPSNGNISIYSEGLKGVTTVQVFDVLGRKIYSGKDISSSFEIKNLPKGVFWLKLSNQRNSLIEKVVIE